MTRTYAVMWRVDRGPIFVGKLELGDDVRLGGADGRGRAVGLWVERDEIVSVRAAARGERLRGCRTVVLVRRTGDEIAVASLDWPGTALELRDSLASG